MYREAGLNRRPQDYDPPSVNSQPFNISYFKHLRTQIFKNI